MVLSPAELVLDALAQRRQIPPLTASDPALDEDGAYAIAFDIRDRRRARGEKPVGRKIGFTNRNIWKQYGVFAPIWGPVYDTTLTWASGGRATVAIGHLLEPRVEPEIVLHFAQDPPVTEDPAAILASIDWIAHGFEIVQSPFAGWRFRAPDTVAVGGLHGAYFIGPRHALRAADAAAWLAALSRFTITLARDGTTIDHGSATNVLDGPLSALRHLVGLLAHDPENPPLAAGEIVTTGTLTRAFPVAPGESWRTALDGLPVDGIAIRFV
jgi:2-oxo-3-hexenedioate decarboxylase